jgi:hypothetical protein
MPTTKKGKSEPAKVIGSISKLVGTVVGTTVVTGKRVIRSVKSSNDNRPKKSDVKSTSTPAKKRKKAVRKAGVKTSTTKKKKVTKRKGTGSSGVSGASKKITSKSPAKKKKVATRKKITTRRTTKKATSSKGLNDSQIDLKPEIDTGTNVPIEGQESQL